MAQTSNQRTDTNSLDRKKLETVAKYTTALIIALNVVLWFGFLRDFFIIPQIWKVVDKSSDRYDVRDVRFSADGSLWLLSYGGINKNDQVRHVTDAKTYEWDMPPIPFEEFTFVSIAWDKNDQPWLINGKKLLHWEAGSWGESPTPLNGELLSFICPSIITEDSIVWGIDNATEENRVLRLDLNQTPIQAEEILLPDVLDPKQDRFTCIIPMNGAGFLAAIQQGDDVDLYHFDGRQWQLVTLLGKDVTERVSLEDIAVDSHNQIWVLVPFWVNEKQVGKYDPASDTWTWFETRHPDLTADVMYEYHNIVVDRLDRVWISASLYGGSSTASNTYDYDAVEVYEQEEVGTLKEIRHYSPDNSGVEASGVSDLVLGKDGKIWSWREQLVWMDSSQQTLPMPWPTWLIFTLSDTVRMVITIIIFIPLIALLVIQFKLKNKISSQNNIT